MRKLVDQCEHENYIIIDSRKEYISNIPLPRTVMKETYACVDCGKGLDIYYWEEQ